MIKLSCKGTAICFTLIAILILGSACNSWPVLYEVKNPGRRAELPPLPRKNQATTEPINQAVMASTASDTQLSDALLQRSVTSTLPLPDSTGLGSVEADITKASELEVTSTSERVELTPASTSSEPIERVQLASSVVPVNKANLAPEPTTRLVIAGVRPERGKVKVAIYTDASTFPNPVGASRTFELAATNSTIETTLPQMTRFAVAVYQDINSDSELNRNRMGIPTEPFAFSNNAMGKRGPPSFAEAAVDHPTAAGDVGEKPLVVSIQLP